MATRMLSNSLLPNNNENTNNNSKAPNRTPPRLRSGGRRRNSPEITQGNNYGGSLLWTLLAMGVLFCLLDVLYIVKYVMEGRHNNNNNLTPILQLDRIAQHLQAMGPAPARPRFTVARDESETDLLSDADPDENTVRNFREKAAGAAAPPQQPVHVDVEKDEEIPDIPHQLDETPLDNATEIALIAQLSVDKEPIIRLLTEAGFVMDADMLRKLPTWTQVTQLYGSAPVYFGLEQCPLFQSTGMASDHFVSTAGTFNTGTNLMAELLIHNCHMPLRMQKYGPTNRGVRWQVTWGKHTPVDNENFRVGHAVYNDSSVVAANIFPAVMVRDPYKWMQSMCRHEYGANWQRRKDHCPNLVPDDLDRATFPGLTGQDSVPVEVTYKEFKRNHESLAGFWNDWYTDYLHASFPRLIVRFEDVIFHPKEVTKTVCECAGGAMNEGNFKYIVDSAKKGAVHGKEKTSYIDAIVKYGTEEGRYSGFEEADLDYAQNHLDSMLMETFRYRFSPSSSAEEASA